MQTIFRQRTHPMTIQETFLPSPTGSIFQTRLYYNRESLKRNSSAAHSHPVLEISVPRECSGTYTVRNQQIPFEPGDIFVFRSNEEHCITSLKGEQDPVCLGIHFYPSILWSAGDSYSAGSFLRYFSAGNREFHNRMPASSPYTGQMQLFIQNIEKEFENKKAAYDLSIHLSIISLLICVMREYPARDEQLTSCSPESLQRISDAMHYIDIHFAEDLTLKEIAEQVNVSPAHFSHLFRSINGFTLWDYVISRRISIAQRMLLESDDSVLNIAFECGFHNSTHFNQCFRKLTGMTPSQYRKS